MLAPYVLMHACKGMVFVVHVTRARARTRECHACRGMVFIIYIIYISTMYQPSLEDIKLQAKCSICVPLIYETRGPSMAQQRAAGGSMVRPQACQTVNIQNHAPLYIQGKAEPRPHQVSCTDVTV